MIELEEPYLLPAFSGKSLGAVLKVENFYSFNSEIAKQYHYCVQPKAAFYRKQTAMP